MVQSKNEVLQFCPAWDKGRGGVLVMHGMGWGGESRKFLYFVGVCVERQRECLSLQRHCSEGRVLSSDVMLCVLHLCLTGWADWSSLGERGLAFPALGMVMEGTKLGRKMRGGWRLLLPLRGDGQEDPSSGHSPQLVLFYPFPSQHQLGADAGRRGWYPSCGCLWQPIALGNIFLCPCNYLLVPF